MSWGFGLNTACPVESKVLMSAPAEAALRLSGDDHTGNLVVRGVGAIVFGFRDHGIHPLQGELCCA